MRGRVHEPGDVIGGNQADAHSPYHPRPSTGQVKNNRNHDGDDVIDRFKPAIETLLMKIRRVTLGDSLHLLALWNVEHPQHVAPPEAFGGGMRVTRSVAVLMVLAVQGYPLHRASLHGERAADSHKVFDNLRRFERAMSQQAVVADANPEATAKNVQTNAHQDGTPSRLPENGQRAEVDEHEKDSAQRREILAVGAINCAELEGCVSHRVY